MASIASNNHHIHREAETMMSVKSLAESTNLTSIPTSYIFTKNPNNNHELPLLEQDQEVKIPIIDFSLLTSGNSEQRSKVIAQLTNACQNWGFFMVTNHGVAEELMSGVLQGVREFFNLSEEEKLAFKGNHVLDPIRCGTSFNASVEKVFYWRDYLKVFVHPQFHFPNNQSDFSEMTSEYCKRIREVVTAILEGISESLGLTKNYIFETLNMESSFQMFIANLYPPCPQPELALGMPPHSDHGLLTFLTQNDVDGLQIQHNGRWLNVNAIPNSFLVNTGDHLEILSNGKYKSIIHRVVVNHSTTRISLAISNGPSLDTVVTPAPELVEIDRSGYAGIKYNEFIKRQQSNNLDGKSILDRLRL